ncbi:MHYT domain-containing protein [Orrella sp. JC864]|uniref:MHYT domain-containing protein n=1 Tax=Orrella sp. JC864 TaxID=3120298 RepID=UPI0030080A6E
MNPGDVVPLAFDASLVALSYVIAALGAYVALLAAARIRRCGQSGQLNMAYVALAAAALGGVGIWSMHFIGMQAQVIALPVYYHGGKTLLSLAVAVLFSGAALWYVGHGTSHDQRWLVGGLLAGAGVAGMHYIGMSAMRMPAVVEWSLPLVLVSVAIAVAAAGAALWMAFSIEREWQRVVAALFMAGAVCGMHYTGAAAGTIVCVAPPSEGVAAAGLMGGRSLPYVVFLLSAATLVGMRWLLHRTSAEYRAQVSARVNALLAGDVPRR